MSDPGTAAPLPDVMQIGRAWLRDLTIAGEILARPFSIFITSVGATAAVFTIGGDEVRAAAIGMLLSAAGGVAYLRSRDKDKRAEFGARP